MKFDITNCDGCGECLLQCPYVTMSPSKAKKEINRLLKGNYSILHDRCSGCMTCTAFCKSGNDPYALIRNRWEINERKNGMPAKARFLMPSARPNFRDNLPMSEKEKNAISELQNIPRGRDVLYTGCNTLLFPDLLGSTIFDGLEPFGALDYCCGEMYYRMGFMDAAKSMATNLQKVFSNLKAERMVFTCAACMNIISNVYPKEFGIEFPFEKTFISDWILAKLESGELHISKKLNGTITIQDSCHSKVMNPKIHDSPRKLMETLGLKVVEMKHSKDNSLCCGIAAACSRYKAVDMAAAALKRLSETAQCGADLTMAYCFGCQMTLSMAQTIIPLAPPVVPMLHLVRKALGENDNPAIYKNRSIHMMKSIATATAPRMLTPSRFNVCEILKNK